MLYIVAIVISAILVLLLYMWKEAHLNVVSYQSIELPNFPSSFGEINIFFISDIHRRTVSTQMLDELKIKPDLVVIAGDLAEKGVPFTKVNENIERLKKIGPVYFVWGNNDYELDHHLLDAMLQEHGVKVLANTAAAFESETGEQFFLLGVDDLSRKRDRLDLAIADSGSGFKVLVGHDPRIVKKITEDDDIDLVLSGHTHGGQIRLGKWGVYKRGGLDKLTSTTIFVSNGYGTTAVPLRLGAPAEVHLLTITVKQSSS